MNCVFKKYSYIFQIKNFRKIQSIYIKSRKANFFFLYKFFNFLYVFTILLLFEKSQTFRKNWNIFLQTIKRHLFYIRTIMFIYIFITFILYNTIIFIYKIFINISYVWYFIYSLRFNIKTIDELPKHMPQRPVRTIKVVIQPMSPTQVILKIANETIRTIMVCPNTTMNCVITWPKRISVPVRPE